MSRKRIATSEDSSTVLLPQEMLNQMDVKAGDEIEVSIVDRNLILSSVNEAERARKFGAATQTVFERRKTAYEELAKGAE